MKKNIINQEKAVSSISKASKVLPNKKKQKLNKIKKNNKLKTSMCMKGVVPVACNYITVKQKYSL